MIIIAIIALVLGVLFIMKFNWIDRKLFGGGSSDEDYIAYGIESLFLSVVAGAVIGGGAFLADMFDMGFSLSSFYLFALLMMAMLVVYNLFISIALEHSVGATIGKFLFLLISITLGFAIGVAGAVIVLAVAILALALYFIKVMLLGTGEKVEVEDRWGNKKTLENGLGGEWRDSWGKAHKRDGDTFTPDN